MVEVHDGTAGKWMDVPESNLRFMSSSQLISFHNGLWSVGANDELSLTSAAMCARASYYNQEEKEC